MQMNLSLIDVCLPDFLCDHCNGDSELLLGVYVDGSTTLGAVRQGVLDEFRASSDERPPAWLTSEALAAHLDSEFLAPGALESDLFDSRLETPAEDDDCGESCQAWFRLSWSEDSDGPAGVQDLRRPK